MLWFSQVPKHLVCRTTRPVLVLKFQVSRPFLGSFSKFLWLRSNPLYQTHACTGWRVFAPSDADGSMLHFLLDASIMASNRYLIDLVKLWLFVILWDFFIPLYFITVLENRKNQSKLRKQKIAQKDFCMQWNEKQYKIRIQRSLNYSPQHE